MEALRTLTVEQSMCTDSRALITIFSINNQFGITTNNTTFLTTYPWLSPERCPRVHLLSFPSFRNRWNLALSPMDRTTAQGLPVGSDPL